MYDPNEKAVLVNVWHCSWAGGRYYSWLQYRNKALRKRQPYHYGITISPYIGSWSNPRPSLKIEILFMRQGFWFQIGRSYK